MGRAATAEKQKADRALVLSRHAVSRETVERLDRYIALLQTWQARINLIAPSTLPDVWVRHVEDALVLHERAKAALRWADLGSGAGFPGLVLAILNAGKAGAQVDLIESNGKKAAFLRTVVRELELPAAVHASRIEASGALLAGAEAVSARALAPLAGLLALAEPHLAPGAVCWFTKGRQAADEIAEAAAIYEFAVVSHVSGFEEGSVILEISGIRRRASGGAG